MYICIRLRPTALQSKHIITFASPAVYRNVWKQMFKKSVGHKASYRQR